ncbi:MFS transporter [Lactiplantibacillus mudanjiangensis]|uniref:MFS transporter [Lactobacillus pentosus] n=1 Tax=Lactiplantibacillus mudanjiangensis TaxID=1296538 RepID=A0A660DVJ2_9LACO|nr:MFS transporter [Lactiplantibacillus mudanjiangensis]VDG22501.1 MFS transporter [Lactobacillus pentosus] [Lactiplantibacillus mudanjiangensis]VDG26957.1 MFS transporter [Lactobacillus pentosus] [Lactiplantibacillus mudanjiangensis]
MTKKKIALAFGILSMNLLLMSGSVVGAAIAAISKSFPTEPISKVQMLSSIPQLGQLVATLLFTWLTYKLTRKNIGLVAVAFVAISGLLPAFYNSSLNIILACMVVFGFGLGLISNVVPVLLQEYFDGEERATVMGWSMGFSNIGMMASTAIGGVLGGTNWRNLFWIYAIAVVIFVAIYALLPKGTKLTAVDKDSKNKTSLLQSVKGLSGYVYVILIVSFVMSLVMMTFMSNQSIVLAAKGEGTAYTALVTAIGNVGGILTAFGLKYIRKMTRKDTMAWGFVALALSFMFVVFFSNPVMHILGNMFSGAGIVMVNATIPFELSVLANKKQFPIVIAMNTLMTSIAGVSAPIILAALNISAGDASFIIGMGLSIVIAALLLVLRFGSRVDKVHQAKAATPAAPSNEMQAHA